MQISVISVYCLTKYYFAGLALPYQSNGLFPSRSDPIGLKINKMLVISAAFSLVLVHTYDHFNVWHSARSCSFTIAVDTLECLNL